MLKKGGLLITVYIPRYYVFQYVATNNVKYLDGHLAKQLIETGILKHDDEKCFWTDTYYSSKKNGNNLWRTWSENYRSFCTRWFVTSFIAKDRLMG